MPRSTYLLDIVTLAPWGSPFFRLVAEHEAVFAALPATLHAALVRDLDWVEELARPWRTPQGQRSF